MLGFAANDLTKVRDLLVRSVVFAAFSNTFAWYFRFFKIHFRKEICELHFRSFAREAKAAMRLSNRLLGAATTYLTTPEGPRPVQNINYKPKKRDP